MASAFHRWIMRNTIRDIVLTAGGGGVAIIGGCLAVRQYLSLIHI